MGQVEVRTAGHGPKLVSLSGSHVGVAICDENLRYASVNETLARINGVPLPAHIGQRVCDILGPAVARTLEPKLESILAGRCKAVSFELVAKLLHRKVPGRWIGQSFPVTRNGIIRAIGTFVVEIDFGTDSWALANRTVVLSEEPEDVLELSELAIRDQVKALTNLRHMPPSPVEAARSSVNPGRSAAR
jgi:PAS fold